MADKSSLPENANAIVIGGGFFGCSLSLMLRERGLRPIILEGAAGLLTRASYHNQARVHSGYHYPRSLMTALRSSISFPRFIKEFSGCIETEFEKYYAVARTGSKVSARQFEAFMKRIDAPLKPAPKRVQKLFNCDLVESVYLTREVAFDARKLAAIMEARLREASIPVYYQTEATAVRKLSDEKMTVEVSGASPQTIQTAWVFNCTYSRLNFFQASVGLPPIPLKHELAEMPLIEPPEELRHFSVTMMCGPFFSLMPFPDRELCTLSHVRYTPHASWLESGAASVDPYRRFEEFPKKTSFLYMVRDASRYLPAMRHCEYRDSLWEVKTVLPQCELDDGRPILFTSHPSAPRLVHIMGGKIDNIYDIPKELDGLRLTLN